MNAVAPPATGAAAEFSVRRLGPCFGASIHHLDIRQPLGQGTAQALRAALAEHQILVIPDQDVPAETFIAFARQLGELSIHPFSPNAGDIPELIILDNHGDNEPLATDIWHSDETFRATPPLATVLRSTITPELGGDTLFASMTAAYDRLSERMKAHIEGLEGVHDFVPFRKVFADTPEAKQKLRDIEDRFPRVTHPMVRVHPETGKRALFVNRLFTIGIKDVDDREAAALLDVLFRQVDTPEIQYRFSWQQWPRAIVIWDNRSTQHYAARDYLPQRRRMERCTLKGDRPEGPIAVVAEKKARFQVYGSSDTEQQADERRPVRQAFK